jgi:hypothetical protein
MEMPQVPPPPDVLWAPSPDQAVNAGVVDRPDVLQFFIDLGRQRRGEYAGNAGTR